MRLLEKIRQKPILVQLFVIGAVAAGVLCVGSMRVSLYPPVEAPFLTLIISYHGMEPEKLERLVTIPVEEAIAPVGGIKTMRSVTKHGEVRIYLELYEGVDPLKKSLQIRDAIEKLKASWPREVEEPQLLRYNPAAKPVLILALKSKKVDLNSLKVWARAFFKPLLQRIDGVSEVEITGGKLNEVKVEFFEERVRNSDINIETVFKKIKEENTIIPCGKLLLGNKEISVYAGQNLSIRDIENLRIKGLKLAQLAQVKEGPRTEEKTSHLNGKEAVIVYISRTPRGNPIYISGRVKSLLKSLPSYISYKIVNDVSRTIKKGINQVLISGTIGMILAVVSLFVFFKNIKAGLVVAASLPVSLCMAFVLMKLTGVNINALSLSGLVLGVGMLLDSSIIVLETWTASSFDSRIVKALFASTLTTVIVFIPVLFLPQSTRAMYSSAALSLTYSLVSAFLVAIVLVPYLAEKLGVKNLKNSAQKIISFYLKSLRFVLKWMEPRLFAAVFAGVILLGLFSLFGVRKEAIEPVPSPLIYGYVELPPEYGMDATERITTLVEERCLCVLSGKVENITSKISRAHSDLFIRLKDGVNPAKAVKTLSSAFADFRRAFVYFVESTASGKEKELKIDFCGKDRKQLKKLVKEAARSIQALKCVEDVVFHFKRDVPVINFYISRERLKNIGVSVTSLAWHNRYSLLGGIVTKLKKTWGEEDVRLKFAGKKHLEDLIGLAVGGIHVKDLVEVKKELRPATLWRKNRENSLSLGVKIKGGTMSAIQKIKRALSRMKFPPDYFFEIDEEEIKRALGAIKLGIGVALFLVYASLCVILESYFTPLLVLSVVPFSFAVVLLVLWALGMSLNLSTGMGLILLTGTSVNNSILFITSKSRNVLQAARERFSQIIITTATTILGFLPLAFSTGAGRALWQPLAVCFCSGLFISTLYVLILMPIIYKNFAKNLFQ